MTREKFLTVRWNNVLSLGLGIPTVLYALAAMVQSTAPEFPWFVGMAIIGSLF